MVSYYVLLFENSFNVKIKLYVLYLLKKLIFSSVQVQVMDRLFLNFSKNKINLCYIVYNIVYCVFVIFFFFINLVNVVLFVIYIKVKLFIVYMI